METKMNGFISKQRERLEMLFIGKDVTPQEIHLKTCEKNNQNDLI